MKIYLDLQKQAITKTTDEKTYEGDFYSNVFEVLFYNYTDSNWFPTMSQLAPNGRKAGEFTADALNVGESHEVTEDGVTYLKFDFTMGTSWVLMKGRSEFYIWFNRLGGAIVQKKCVGVVNVMIDQSTTDYFIADPTFNPNVKAYIDYYLAALGDGSPKYFDTASNIANCTEDKGLAVATDTGHLYYWDETKNSTTKYTDSGLVYNDLSAYYTKTEVDSALALKADKSDTYTRNVINNFIADLETRKADKSNTYTIEQVDNLVKTQAFYRNKTVLEGLGYYSNIPYSFENGCVYWLLYQGDSASATFRTYDSNSQYHNEIVLSNNVMVKFISDNDYLGVRWAIGNLTIIRESDIEKDSIEYKYFTEKFNNLVNYLGDIQFIEDTQFDLTIGEYWNKEFSLNIPKGSVMETALLEYTGDYFNSFTLQLKDTSNNWNVIATTSNIGERLRYVADKNYTTVRLQIYRSTVEHNVVEKIMWVSNVKNGFIKDALNHKTYYLKKDGTGDFTSIVTAINTVCNEKNATLYIGDGTWDIVDELGSTFMESVTQNKRGLYLKNGVHIICSSKSLIVAKYTGTNATTREWFSAFNTGEGGFILENATIESDNIRYTVHDERNEDADIYYNHYINCKMKHTNGFYVQCIGGGLGLDGHIIIDGCIFETDKTSSVALVSYHNCMDGGWTDATSQNARSFIDIKNNYFSKKGNIRITIMGKSQKVSNVLISNNSLGSNITVENSVNYYWYDNVDVKQWNNEVRS